jgi:Ca2+-transporting ATPase
MVIGDKDIYGLNDKQVATSRAQYGANQMQVKVESRLLQLLKSMLRDPMIILLLAAAVIYFLTNHISDGIFMLLAISLIAIISRYQEARSNDALKRIREMTRPTCKVIRNGDPIDIPNEDVVVGDYLIIGEGAPIPADGTIISANDFSVDESALTGEALPVHKTEHSEDRQVYRGTTVSSGIAVATVTAIGNATRLGMIGETIDQMGTEKTPLELQIDSFVRKMVVIGIVIFLAIWTINFYQTGDFTNSLLRALTLAMSILPEEIPVAFTTFMALGSWRLMQMGIIVKQMKTVETLGSATVICSDKTGTLTENRMAIAELFILASNSYKEPQSKHDDATMELIRFAMWASEPMPFDPMETAIHQLYGDTAAVDERGKFSLVREYPLGGTPPMMTHIFQNADGTQLIAAKGAPEALIHVSGLDSMQRQHVEAAVTGLASKGYRVLGVAQGCPMDIYPNDQREIKFRFIGLLAFYDPPKANIGAVLQSFYDAGVKVKVITGDNPETTAAIAGQVGLRGVENRINGAELIKLNEERLRQQVVHTNLFSRIFPEAKLRIINALKANGEIVAMTGDGINDGPALKAAHIGIAMGKKGTEIAKDAASLILIDDDLSKMTDAIAMGRRIYANLKKAIQYIISIHIPIILTVSLPVVLGWAYPDIFSPVHIIFLELIMGPTCSIIYEREPMEQNAMHVPPRPFTSTFFNMHELSVSILQGLVITAGNLFVYHHAINSGYDEATTRTMVFLTLVTANILLTLENRSLHDSLFRSWRNKNRLIPLIISITIAITALLLYVPVLRRLFSFEQPDTRQLMVSIVVGILSVIWFEVVKWIRRARSSNTNMSFRTKNYADNRT